MKPKSFKKKLEEALGDVSRAHLFVDGEEIEIPEHVTDDEWVEYAIERAIVLLGQDWFMEPGIKGAFVNAPGDPGHIAELWMGEPPSHAEDIPEERVKWFGTPEGEEDKDGEEGKEGGDKEGGEDKEGGDEMDGSRKGKVGEN